jgi:hypothetical protein
LKVNENLNQLKGWTNGGPLVKLVKGEGRATRARARSPRRAVAVGMAVAEAEARRGEARRVVTVMRMHCFCHSCQS